MEMVKLKNGSEELKSLVAVVMASIKKLNPLAAYDLIMLCRDRTTDRGERRVTS